MKRLFAALLSLIVTTLPFYKLALGQSSVETQGRDIILIITSYNPESPKTIQYITEIEQYLSNSYPGEFSLLVENLSSQNFSTESYIWPYRIQHLLDNYKKLNLSAIITIGQEAWAALTSQKSSPKGVPIFGAFISSDAIELPSGIVSKKWSATHINSIEKALRFADAGGSYVRYSPLRNIELILSLFPEVKNIAFVSDNSYGGVALKAAFKSVIPQMDHLNFHFIDSRKENFSELKEKINALPAESAILIATWKINYRGQYYIASSLVRLLDGRPELPVFTLTGAGLESVAIGGYIPNHNHPPAVVAKQIVDYRLGHRKSLSFVSSSSQYHFNSKKLEQFKIKKRRLPENSLIVNQMDPLLRNYYNYLVIVSSIALLLLLVTVALIRILGKNRKLNNFLKTRQEELTEAKRRAEESDNLKSAFLANMSHEIRTPLNSIVGFSNLLVEEQFSEEEREGISSIIAENSNLLLTLITDILDISGLETDMMAFTFEELEVNALCRQVMSTLGQFKKEGIEYNFTPATEQFFLMSDRHRLTQVLLNLLTNSNKFTESGSITLEYSVDIERGWLLFSVTDSGIGIPKEDHDKIFKRFGKLNSHRQGNGLGLAISKEIVNRLGGEIWIDEEYTQGARFYFSHPI